VSAAPGPPSDRDDPRPARSTAAKPVFLRQPAASDEAELVALTRASRRLHRPWVSPPLDGVSFQGFLARARRPNALVLLACRAEDGAIAGVFHLDEIVRGVLQSAYLSYYVGAPYAGQGYMTAGLRLLLRHAFVALRLHRLEANIQPGNLASIALVERCGFELEGFSPRYLKIRNRWRDHQRWALRVEAWRARRGDLPGVPRLAEAAAAGRRRGSEGY
jgi:ribosomal-protein-alanine N-acetyltransferase